MGLLGKTATWWKWTRIGLVALALSLLAAAILSCIVATVALILGLGLGLNSAGKFISGLDENQARFDNLGVLRK